MQLRKKSMNVFCVALNCLFDLYLLGQDLLDHFLHPGSLRVQANLLACPLQSGTATPKENSQNYVDEANKWR